MTPVGIAGIGLVTAAGAGVESTWTSLLRRDDLRSAIAPAIRKPTNIYKANVPEGQGNRLVRMAAMAIDEAVPWQTSFPNPTVLCLGSTTAAFRERQSRELGLEFDPDFLTPGAVGEYLAKMYFIDEVFQFSQACASSGYAIAVGCELINQGLADVVLAGGVDEVVECVVDAFQSCRIYADECKPFDADRKGLILGEAAAFVLLCRQDLLEGYRSPCYIVGTGLTCDAHDMAAPFPDGIVRAIDDAAPGILPNFIVAHATGTKVGDAAEAAAIRRSGLGGTPVASYKGSLGHPQGASGAVGVVLGVMSYLRSQRFPTVGFESPDPELFDLNVVDVPSMLVPDRILCLSSGTWGVNSAITLGRFRTDSGKSVKDRTGIIDFCPTPDWPSIWAAGGGRPHPNQFGLTVSNSAAGQHAIKHGLTGPQIALSYGNPYKLAKLMVDGGKATSMLVADQFTGGEAFDEIH